MIALSVGFGAGSSDLRALAQPAAPAQTAPASPQAIPTDTLSFADRLSRLELLHELLPTAADMPILDRLTRLEQKLLGQTGTGSIIERLKNLESLRAKSATPVGATPVTNSSAPPAVPAATAPPPPTPSSQGSMADFIKSAQVSKIVVLSDIYPPSFSRIQAASDTQPDKSDYLDAVLKESKNKVLKFQKMPVPVYITPIQEFGFNKAVREALDDWGARTNGLVSFVEVKNQKDARVVVIFSRLGLKPESDCSLGAHTVTKWKSRGAGKLAFLPVGSIPVPLYIPAMGPKYSVPPQLIEVNLDVIYGQDPELRPLVLKNIATHELGHALGMLGHSPVKGDMMYMNTDEYSRISQRDINTVTRLYHRKADIPL